MEKFYPDNYKISLNMIITQTVVHHSITLGFKKKMFVLETRMHILILLKSINFKNNQMTR